MKNRKVFETALVRLAEGFDVTTELEYDEFKQCYIYNYTNVLYMFFCLGLRSRQ